MLDIFDECRWQKIQDSYEAWWQRKTAHPILNLSFYGADPGMRRPEGLITGNLFHYDFCESAESIAEKSEYLMRSLCYDYEGFPYVFMYFGPVHTFEFFGARAHIAPDTVWYAAENLPPIEEMHIALDHRSVFYPRYREIAKACEERFGGGYAISGPSAGGYCLDMVAEFYKPDKLGCLLYDKPDEINRLSMEFHKASQNVAKSLIALTPSARGYSSWGGMFAPIPWAGLQCDFSAMIGPEHFERFVKWDLELAVSESPRYNYYHLDGTGELIHLDSILAIEDLKCVQWVPEPGTPGIDSCPEIYKKISDANKNIWVLGGLENVEIIADQIGTAKGLYWCGSYPVSERERITKLAERLTKA